MKQHDGEVKSNSFTETVQIVQKFVQQEIIRETHSKQLYYHTLDHALAVKRRASKIFQAIASILLANYSSKDWKRLEQLLNLCALAHDMVQVFADTAATSSARKRYPRVSETATVDKLLDYIKKLNQTLEQQHCHHSVKFTPQDMATIQEAIMATVCQKDPQAGKASYSFSTHSIYQPYLYQENLDRASILAKIVALADLGTLGMEGAGQYIKEGILVFLEDNLDLKSLIFQGEFPPKPLQDSVRTRLLTMARFMVSLAEERQGRFELEIASFSEPIRQILRQKLFIHLNLATISQIKQTIPTNQDTTLSELINFFHWKPTGN